MCGQGIQIICGDSACNEREMNGNRFELGAEASLVLIVFNGEKTTGMNWINPPQHRSVACNGEVIRFYRRMQDWTQQQLADAAGYTRRVIAKAESGGSLYPDTVEVIAEALSTEQRVVYPEDITSSPREMTAAVLRAITEYEANAVEHMQHLLADNLEVHFPGGPESAPLSGVHRGIEGYDKLMKAFFEIFQRPDKEVAKNTAVITADGNRAVLSCFETLDHEFIPTEVRQTGEAGALCLFLLFSRGKIAKIQYLFDTKAFGLAVTAWREHPSNAMKDQPTTSTEYYDMKPWLKGGTNE